MADDIVEQLRLHRVAACRERSCMVCDCADEIERLREERDEARAEASMKGYRLDDALDEIERLRAAGDALAKQITKPCRCVEAHDGAINETCAPCAACFDWQEARRG